MVDETNIGLEKAEEKIGTFEKQSIRKKTYQLDERKCLKRNEQSLNYVKENIHKHSLFVEKRDLMRLEIFKEIWLNNFLNLITNLDNYYQKNHMIFKSTKTRKKQKKNPMGNRFTK